MEIWTDMDGTIVDLMPPALERNGITNFDFTKCEGKYGKIPQMIGSNYAKFWAKCSDKQFWASLSPYPGAVDFLERCALIAKVRVITTPIHIERDECVAGKRDWLHAVAEDFVDLSELYFVDSKAEFAKPDRLLLDDSDDNVNEWREAGGRAVLIPQPWNSAADKREFLDFPDLYEMVLGDVYAQIHKIDIA